VKAVDTEFASQTSISAQQEPWLPVPVLGLLPEGSHPSTLAYTNVSSRYHARSAFGKAYLSIDELDVLWALRITVSSTVLGASSVVRKPRHTTIGIHGDEVQGSVEPARQVRDVDIEGKFIVLELEHFIFVLGCHHVDTRSSIGTGDEGKVERAARGDDAVSALVVGAVKCAILGTCRIVWAQRGVPCVALE